MLRRAALLCAILLSAAPAMAADLRGFWSIHAPTDPGYVGSVVVDAENRVRLDSPKDSGRPANFIGYVKTNAGKRVEMVMTDSKAVVRTECLRETDDKMFCNAIYKDGTRSVMFTLTRVGEGPTSLTEHSRPR